MPSFLDAWVYDATMGHGRRRQPPVESETMVDVNTQGTLDALFPHLVTLRRHLHQNPELAYNEVETAQTIISELDSLGIPFDYTGKGGGVIGRLVGPRPGRTIALRAEMDALPCNEETGLPFASRVRGRMHACGHDVHMSMLVGAATLLKADPPDGTVLFVFQPAEETGNGSCAVLESKALDGAEAIFAGHVTHHYRLGQIMVSSGTITAHADRFTVRVRGRGGHGARPHEAVDAVVITGLLITAIQTLVSRGANPVHPSVVTIGSIRAGTAHNVIAEHAVLEGTVRTTRPEARDQIIEGLHRMASAFGHMHGAEIDVEFGENAPPVVNTPRETDAARRAATQTVGPEAVVEQEYPSMGAEDFSFYLEKIPGCYVRIGTRGPDDEYVPLHSPRFDVDERVLRIGTEYFDRVAREALQDA